MYKPKMMVIKIMVRSKREEVWIDMRKRNNRDGEGMDVTGSVYVIIAGKVRYMQ